MRLYNRSRLKRQQPGVSWPFTVSALAWGQGWRQMGIPEGMLEAVDEAVAQRVLALSPVSAA